MGRIGKDFEKVSYNVGQRKKAIYKSIVSRELVDLTFSYKSYGNWRGWAKESSFLLSILSYFLLTRPLNVGIFRASALDPLLHLHSFPEWVCSFPWWVPMTVKCKSPAGLSLLSPSSVDPAAYSAPQFGCFTNPKYTYSHPKIPPGPISENWTTFHPVATTRTQLLPPSHPSQNLQFLQSWPLQHVSSLQPHSPDPPPTG